MRHKKGIKLYKSKKEYLKDKEEYGGYSLLKPEEIEALDIEGKGLYPKVTDIMSENDVHFIGKRLPKGVGHYDGTHVPRYEGQEPGVSTLGVDWDIKNKDERKAALRDALIYKIQKFPDMMYEGNAVSEYPTDGSKEHGWPSEHIAQEWMPTNKVDVLSSIQDTKVLPKYKVELLRGNLSAEDACLYSWLDQFVEDYVNRRPTRTISDRRFKNEAINQGLSAV